MAKVSVLIPTYNRRAYVQEAIDSVLAQTYENFEIIVVDDGSTDGTGEALRERYGDRIQHVWQENAGESVARNRGAEMARGEYIGLLDSDDLWLPEKLAEQIVLLDGNPDLVLVFSQARLIDQAGNLVDAPPTNHDLQSADLEPDRMYVANSIHTGGSSVVMRRDVFCRSGGFDPTIRFGEDWDLWLRLVRTGSFGFGSKPLALARRHPSGQHRSLVPSFIDQRLSDHLALREKAATYWPHAISQHLKDRAIAQTYGETALQDYLVGRLALAQDRLGHAAHLAPEDWASPIRPWELLVAKAVALVLTGARSPRELESSLFAARRAWPSCIVLPARWRDRVLGEFSARVFYGAHRRQDRQLIRQGLVGLIRYGSRKRWNLGVWSLGAEAVVGTAVSTWLRRCLRVTKAP